MGNYLKCLQVRPQIYGKWSQVLASSTKQIEISINNLSKMSVESVKNNFRVFGALSRLGRLQGGSPGLVVTHWAAIGPQMALQSAIRGSSGTPKSIQNHIFEHRPVRRPSKNGLWEWFGIKSKIQWKMNRRKYQQACKNDSPNHWEIYIFRTWDFLFFVSVPTLR